MLRALQRRPAVAAILSCSLLAAALARPAAAALDPRWQPFGPGGGTITGLAVDRSGRTVHAVASGAVYASRDGGRTWAMALRSRQMAVVAVDPDDPATMFAAGGRILRSKDGGRTWRIVLDVPALHARALAVVPGRRPAVFVLGVNGLRRSTDGGVTWPVVFASPAPLDSLAVDPNHPSTLYVGDRIGVAKSDDSGATWRRVLFLPNPGLSSVLLALAPSRPSTVYAVAGLGARGFAVYRSGDGGTLWASVAGEQPGAGYDRALAVDPAVPSRLYLAGLPGLLGSTDGGATWEPLDGGLPRDLAGRAPAVHALAIPKRHRQTVFAGLAEIGVARSDDAGGRWAVPVQPGLAAAPVQSLAFHPLRPERVYVSMGSEADRGLVSDDAGRTWSFLPRQITRPGLRDLAFDPVDPDRLYAATATGVWRTADGGATWSRLAAFEAFRVATAGPRVVLAAPACGVQRSADGGATWTAALPCAHAGDGLDQSVAAFWYDPVKPDAIYAVVRLGSPAHPAGNAVLRSLDGGATWRELPLANPGLFAVAPSDSRVLYAFAGGALVRSADRGETWQTVNAQDLAFPDSYFSLAVDAANPDTVFLGTYKQVLWSRDRGRTLEPVDPTFGGVFVATDRTRPGILFALPSWGGLFARQMGE